MGSRDGAHPGQLEVELRVGEQQGPSHVGRDSPRSVGDVEGLAGYSIPRCFLMCFARMSLISV